MRMLVIGSSDTDGRSLADPMQVWPNIVANELGEAIATKVEFINLPVVHVGPKAVPRVVDALEKHQPDLVIFAYGGYHFMIATVDQRVRRRYGERAFRVYKRLEKRFERATKNPDGRQSARVNHAGRRLARTIIGAETLATREEVVGIQSEIVRQLSQREGLVVVMLAAPDVPPSMVRDNPRANILLGEHREYMTNLALGHHFLIADCVDDFRSHAVREHLSTSDGIHKSADGHRIQADAIMKTLLQSPSPYAPIAAGRSLA